MNKYLIIAFVFAICGFFWAFLVEPNLLVIQKQKLNIPELKGLKIVFASDWHIAPWEKWRLKKIIREINAQQPDIILLGGDFVKGHRFASSMKPEKIAAELGKLKAPLGVYAVLGNHDWYLDGKKVRQALEKNGIRVLENENLLLEAKGNKFYLAGLADKITRRPDIEKTLKSTTKPTILLTHNPDVFPELPTDPDLILAGHTHGGQVVLPFVGPLIVPSDFGTRFAAGEFDENGKRMIVSKGLGTSLLPLRFNCLPEILVLE